MSLFCVHVLLARKLLLDVRHGEYILQVPPVSLAVQPFIQNLVGEFSLRSQVSTSCDTVNESGTAHDLQII